MSPRAVVVTHGGAGGPRENDNVCGLAARRGAAALKDGHGPMEAVIRATELLEDDPRLNAGTGSNLRLDGKTIEMDAAVMNYDMRFGAVGALRDVQHPIRVAEKVLETPHLFLAGEGANIFARVMGFEKYNPVSERARRRYEEVKKFLSRREPTWEMKRWKDVDPAPFWNYPTPMPDALKEVVGPSDTVGAVARDSQGRCAAALSTGGTSIMLYGRVGDTPLIGSGLYAGPQGAVATTGEGEEIMRVVLAKRVYDWIEEGVSPQEACERGVGLIPQGYVVGIIAVSREDQGIADNRTMPRGVCHPDTL